MKNFIKGMNKEGQAFRYLRNKFPKVSASHPLMSPTFDFDPLIPYI